MKRPNDELPVIDNGTITITKERYEEFLSQERLLRCLEQMGVDNWEGYDIAIDIFNEK